MQTRPSAKYSFRPSTLTDGSAINSLYCNITGYKRSIEHWHWQWHEAPAGPGCSWVIERDEELGAGPTLVGHHGVIRLAGYVDGDTAMLGKTENTMVNPEDRERFLYPRMEAAMLKHYGDEFDGIFSLQGPSAALRLRSALGYRPGTPYVSEIWCYGRMGRLRALGQNWWRSRRGIPHRLGEWDALQPSGREWRSTMDAALTAAIEDLEESSRTAPGVRIAKSPDFISWRYLRHPSRCYAMVGLQRACLVAHEFRRSILVIDEILPSEVADPGLAVVWPSVSEFVLDSGYLAMMIYHASVARSHHSALEACGWRLHRSRGNEGTAPEHGLPIWVNPRHRGDGRYQPTQWVLGASASEGP